MYPMWMCRKEYIEVRVPVASSGSGGGGVTIAHVEKEFPRIRIKKISDNDLIENINIKVLRIIDLSLLGGGNVDI